MPLQLVNNEPEFVDEKRVVAVNHFHILTTRVALRLVAGGGGCVSAEETRAEQMVGIRSEGRYHADDDGRDRRPNCGRIELDDLPVEREAMLCLMDRQRAVSVPRPH